MYDGFIPIMLLCNVFENGIRCVIFFGGKQDVSSSSAPGINGSIVMLMINCVLFVVSLRQKTKHR